MDYQVISVESRKGGVGKTTAALNLSLLLKQLGYAVLLIDIDITGTNIVNVLDSSYWKNKVNPIQYDKTNANLLTIYRDIIMQGRKLPGWKIKKNVNRVVDFELESTSINILGSEIYNNNNNEQHNLICNPSLLFDELHTYWFVEFLQQICSTFAKKIKDRKVGIMKEQKVGIVLDNSPGFVGINPAIHEWLTDIGPANGKFLTISSLDKQDLISCRSAIENLHGLFKAKYAGAKFYADIMEESNPKDFKLSGVSKNFYLRMASKSLSDDAYEAYIQGIDKIDFTDSPHLYQSIVINKVPAEIKNRLLSYGFNVLNSLDYNGNVMKTLLGDSKEKIHHNLVFYDEYINFQFLSSSLARNSNSKEIKQELSIVRRHFTKLEKDIKNFRVSTNNSNLLSSSRPDEEILEPYIKFYQKELDKLIDRFKKSNLGNIVRLISNEWHPKTAIENLLQYFDELLIDYSYPNFDYEDNINNNERINRLLEEFDDGISYRIKDYRLLRELDDKQKIYSSFKTILQLVLSPFLGDYRTIKEIMEITFEIFSIQLESFSNSQSNSEKQPIREFFISESNRQLPLKSRPLSKVSKRLNLRIRSNFSISNFYNAFCKAQVRIIDIDQDFDFLISVLKKVSIGSEARNKILFPFIKDVLDNVIVLKKISHSRAREEIQKGFKSATYMREFQKILKGIIAKWGFDNGS